MEIPVSVFLDAAMQETNRVLKSALPEMGGKKWWENYVIKALHANQRTQIEQAQITDLDDLDLVVLIRIMERHWSEIAHKFKYPNPDDSFTIIKSLKNIRNQYAHKTTKTFTPKTTFRHLDVIERYLEMVKAPDDICDKIERESKRVLSLMQDIKPLPKDEPKPPQTSQSQISTNEPSTVSPEVRMKGSDDGIPLSTLTLEGEDGKKVENLLNEKTYVGIDFGTSTSVVSYAKIGKGNDSLEAVPIPIKQYDELGRANKNNLVSSCIAWTGNDLLVGQGAAELKSKFIQGKNIWFSFKMKLGVDLGNVYYNSDLAGNDVPANIQKPQQAAVVFFNYLRKQIEAFVKEEELPQNIVYSVSVPASFEANQRLDLIKALHEAGIDVPDYGIIDEPNAAFISYLMDTLALGKGIIEGLLSGRKKLMVFDFGAGTCDISILEIIGSENRLQSKNLAISQFHALGGDNIDRQIVREILLNQLYDQNHISDQIFTSTQLSEVVLPKLQSTAEGLKIQCCKYITNNWNGSDITPFIENDASVTGKSIEPFTIGDREIILNEPKMSYKDFSNLMIPFIDPDRVGELVMSREDDMINIFEPIFSALEKAEIEKDELDMILFIGGSSLNPFVQAAIQTYFGRFVETVLSRDIRLPVSQGVAINSLVVNGLKREFLKPIVSEAIYVLTSNAGLQLLIPAGTEIPSPEILYEGLKVREDGQSIIELPLCVTSEDKLLGVIEIKAAKASTFTMEDDIVIKCSIDSNKLMQVTAQVGDRIVNTTILNPLSNKEVTPEETAMLIAQQQLYLDASSNFGRPSVENMIHYAYACAEAENHILCAEAFEAVERLDNERDFATNICYYYARAGKRVLSQKWAEIDHKRRPTDVSAFNLALTKINQQKPDEFERYMQESLQINPDYPAALESYGHFLVEKGHPKGIPMVERALKIMSKSFIIRELKENDIFRLKRAAKTVGRNDIVEEIEAVEDGMSTNTRYRTENLAESKNIDPTSKRGI